MSSSQSEPSYFLVSGGTGGHLFPALSLGEKLKSQNKKVCLITDQRGKTFIESSKFDIRTFDQIYVNALGGRGKSKILKKAWLYFTLLQQTLIWYWRYHQLKPAVVVGFGGYPSLPPLLAAQLRGIPTVIHEQNARLGKANRLLAKKAHTIATSFETPPSSPLLCFSKASLSLTGNPVRSEILDLKDEEYQIATSEQPFRILITGGSQGAKIFSEIIPQALISLEIDLQKKIGVVQQCRTELLEETQALYKGSLIKVELTPFIQDIAKQYSQAHLVIARSGASTLAELAILKKPAILIPYAASKEGDQLYNALPLEQKGAAWVMREGESFTPQNLKALLTDLITQPEKLLKASQQMATFANPLAAETLTYTVTRVAEDDSDLE